MPSSIRTASSQPTTATAVDERVEVRTPSTRSPARITVAAGSVLALEASERICTNTNRVGDRFDARLAEPVVANNGTVIPAGTAATGEISSLSNGDSTAGDGPIGLRISSVTFNGVMYPLLSRVTDADVVKVRSRSSGATVRTAAAGAAVGGLLGRVIGGNTRSTVIGAVGGGVAGGVAANRTGQMHACVPNGGRIIAQLTKPLAIEALE